MKRAHPLSVHFSKGLLLRAPQAKAFVSRRRPVAALNAASPLNLPSGSTVKVKIIALNGSLEAADGPEAQIVVI